MRSCGPDRVPLASLGTGSDPALHSLLPRLAERLGQNRHSHWDSVMHFFDDHRLWAIRNFPREFEAADDWAGMHHDRIRLSNLQAWDGHLIARNVILQAKFGSRQPFFLHSQ